MKSHWINGLWAPSQGGGKREIINPATLEVVDTVVEGTADDARAAVAAAEHAFHHWRKLPGLEKALLMHEIARQLRNDVSELSRLLTLEGGKPRIENMDEVEWCAACFDYYAEIGRNSYGNSVPPTAENQINFTIKEPLGVVGCIVPFNYPLLLLCWKIAPALAAGNTVVIKPSELTPLSTLRACEKAFACLPAGVLNVVLGTGADVGAPIVEHPKVACVAFTGSTAVGTDIAVRCARQLKRVNLELGGIDPFIVFEDADLDVAAHGVAWARFLNAGQVCTSAKRIYVVKSVAEKFLEKFLEYTNSLVVGNGMDPKTDIGPLISQRALDKVQSQVERTIAGGAKLLAGGQRLDVGPGYFWAPTVMSEVKTGLVSVSEELFGPVASILAVEDAEEAINLAAASDYGLGANIYTRNMGYAFRAMNEIKAGTFWINDPLTDNDAAPFGGMRKSGMGRELGEEGLDAFRETKHVHLDYLPSRKSYWFPNVRRAHEIPTND